jgi:hypothetical protein
MKWVAGLLAVAVLVVAVSERSRESTAKAGKPRVESSIQRMLDAPAQHVSTDAQRDLLRDFLARRGVSPSTIAAVLRHTRDGIALRPGPRTARTGIGGRGLLPADAKWPTRQGHPLAFIAAFDFAELPHLDPLPRDGTLALYVDLYPSSDIDFVKGTRAYYLPPGAEIVRKRPPRETFPIDFEPLRGDTAAIAGDPFLVADEIKGRPDADTAFKAMNDLQAAGVYPHHLLGAPIEIQDSMMRGMPGYVLLAQINETKDLMIADGGDILFMAPREDVEARRFDRVVGIWESH